MLTDSQISNRHLSIGGSDAGTIAGVNPYQTARELFHLKRGDIEPADLTDNQAIHFGNVLEDFIAEEYCRRTGYKVRKVNDTIRHPHLEFLTGHIDRNVVKSTRALECKNVGMMSKGWGKGLDEVPEQYLVQCQHYMMLLPKVEVFDLAVLVGGQDFRVYEIPRDGTLIQNLMTLECEFWECVQENRPPAFDYDSPTTQDLLKRLYPGTNGQTVHLPQEAEHWHQVMQLAKDNAKRYQNVADGARAHLQALMGDNAQGVLPDGTAYTRKLVFRRGFTVDDTKYIDFRFTKKPKGE